MSHILNSTTAHKLHLLVKESLVVCYPDEVKSGHAGWRFVLLFEWYLPLTVK